MTYALPIIDEMTETRHRVKLPLTTLQYARCGEGDPVIMVPATISLIDDWLPFVHFMGQRFETYFFELPGHGGSTPFDEPFSSELVARTVADLVDHLGYEKVTLMGFSFGGILMFKTLQLLGDRVDKVIMLSPCISRRALRHSAVKLNAVKAITATFSRPLARSATLRLMRDPRTIDALSWFMTVIGKYETSADLKNRLADIPESTFRTVVNQVREILSLETSDLAGPYEQRCFFGMSVNDPLLDFQTTHDFVVEQFADPIVERFDFPYHCPSEPFTFEQLNRDYPHLLSAFDD